jgi:hypothetical protein
LKIYQTNLGFGEERRKVKRRKGRNKRRRKKGRKARKEEK